jgi:A/G-specific adenine glycosylase
VQSDAAIADIRLRLLAFYDERARDLPWRRDRDAYGIWISEVMAQQTRIDTVIPYWRRWMARFPDVGALAAAHVDDVLEQWEGLGYYSRARHLHAAAQVIRERHQGLLPADANTLRTLPGVGDYTAGAVASMAYGRAEPAVDGNVRRVLARLLDDPAPAPARLRSVAAALVPDDRPGEFNQALMELGSLVCTLRSPRCAECPIADHCRARAHGTQHERPRRVPKKPVPTIAVATLVVRRPDDRVLLVRRPAAGLLAGLWTFPGIEQGIDDDVSAATSRVLHSLGIRTRRRPMPLGSVPHVFSHRREIYHCALLTVTEKQAEAVTAAEPAWVGRDRQGWTLPRGQQRIHALAFG